MRAERMKIVVTGGAGFIGANLCRTLVERGVERIVVIDDLSTGSKHNVNDLPVDLRVGSVLDAELLRACLGGAHSVVHLAARPSVPLSLNDPAATDTVNSTGTLRVLEAARRESTHVVIASSSAVYGANSELPLREETTPMPLSPYAASKLAAESYAAAYAHSFDLPTLVFRFFNVFGPLQPPDHAYAAAIPAFLSAALAGRSLAVHGDGGQTRDFIYVGSVARALADAAMRQLTRVRPVNLACGTRTSLSELINVISQLVDRPIKVQQATERLGDIRDSQADISQLRDLLPTLRPVDISVGLRKTIQWMKTSDGRIAVPAMAGHQYAIMND
ncbi:MAG: NAD-dependent epimerase/dehydratase family protein [Carbonactinosporaceae bacterium]